MTQPHVLRQSAQWPARWIVGTVAQPRKCVSAGGAPRAPACALPGLFVVVVPQRLAPPPPANQCGGEDEWQAGPPMVPRGGRGAGRGRSAMLGSSGRLTGLPSLPRERGMEPQVNLRVTCRGETQSFLVSDSAHTTWADVEAMVSTARSAARPQPRAAVAVRRWGRKRLSEGLVSSLSAS